MVDGSSHMGFIARFKNFYNDVYSHFRVNQYIYEIEQPMFNKAFGSDFPSLLDITRNISLAFYNSNEFLEFPRPVSNKLIYIGGLLETRQENKPLLREYQKIFTRA